MTRPLANLIELGYIKETIGKLKRKADNFPKQIDKKIITAAWCKHSERENANHWT